MRKLLFILFISSAFKSSCQLSVSLNYARIKDGIFSHGYFVQQSSDQLYINDQYSLRCDWQPTNTPKFGLFIEPFYVPVKASVTQYDSGVSSGGLVDQGTRYEYFSNVVLNYFGSKVGVQFYVEPIELGTPYKYQLLFNPFFQIDVLGNQLEKDHVTYKTYTMSANGQNTTTYEEDYTPFKTLTANTPYIQFGFELRNRFYHNYFFLDINSGFTLASTDQGQGC